MALNTLNLHQWNLCLSGQSGTHYPPYLTKCPEMHVNTYAELTG